MATFPISGLARILIWSAAALWQNWDQVQRLFDRADEVTDAVYGYRCHLIWEIKRGVNWTAVPTERGESSVAFINVTDDQLDTTWIEDDFAAVETAMSGLVTSLATTISADFRLIAFKWYAFGPGVTSPNPVARETVLGSPIQGSGTTYFHQCATTVTLRTPLRRHWGRFYLPLAPGNVQAGGELLSTKVDEIANAAVTALYGASSSQGVYPVVYDRVRKSALFPTAIECDSVPDVVRRRRPQTTLYRKVIDSLA